MPLSSKVRVSGASAMPRPSPLRFEAVANSLLR
jgi:hypothetical protein